MTWSDKYESILFTDIDIQKNYYEEPAKKIIFTSDNLFTEKFVSDLDTILNKNGNSGNAFRKMKVSEKQEILHKLDTLIQTETMWKDLVKTSKYDSSKIKTIFPEETRQFTQLFDTSFFPNFNEKTKKARSKYGSEKAKIYIKGLFDYIKSDHSDIFKESPFIFEYTEKDMDTLIQNISPTLLFEDLIKISMKKAYDTNINIENSNPTIFRNTPLNTDFFRAKKTDILYPLVNYINNYLASILLNDLAEKKLLKKTDPDYIIGVLKFLDQHTSNERRINTKILEKPWFLLSGDISSMLLDLFENTDVVKSTEIGKKKNSVKKTKTYIFDHKLDASVAFSKHLPRITQPKKAETNECVNHWISPPKGGTINVQVSNEARDALNNAQKKEFVTNTKFINLLKKVDSNRENASEFPTKKDYIKAEEKYNCWKDSPWNNLIDITLYRNTFSLLSVKKTVEKKIRNKTLQLCDISFLESYANAAKNEARADLVKKKSMRQLLQTSIKIGELYKDYPLYYGTSLDFRLRMYPLQYLLSRTTGYLKNILQESESRTLTQKGITYMLEAYYSPNPLLLKNFNNLISKSNNEMFRYFQENKINLEEEPLYFELLELELNDVFCNKQETSLQLEIDQVGSGPTLVALLTRNKVLAEKCNLLEGKFHCVYKYLLRETKQYLQENNYFDLDIDIHNSEAFNLLTQDRKAQKYALMCYFYNEKHRGRTQRWTEQLEEKFGTTVTSNDYKLFSKFSINYPKFMDKCFPNLTTQLDLLNEAMTIVIKQDLPIKFSTLDGCILSWDFEKTIEIKRNYFNPASGSHSQYKYRIPITDGTHSHSRTKKHQTSFRPNFIHALDATIMRIFLQNFYKTTKKRLNHLHDCVMLHPNDVDIFYNIVSDVYCDPRMKTLAVDLFFSRIKKDVVGEPLSKIEKLEKKFCENMDLFELSVDTFDPKKCYRFEGAK